MPGSLLKVSADETRHEPILPCPSLQLSLRVGGHALSWALWVQGKLAPGLLSAMVRHANFERRQGQQAAAKAVFEGVIEAEAGKDGKDGATHAFAVIQYAAFLQQAMGDSSAARLVYEAALAKRTSAKSLWEVCLPSHRLQTCCSSSSLGVPASGWGLHCQHRDGGS